MAVSVIIDTNMNRSSQMSMILRNYGKVFEAGNRSELEDVLRRVGHVTAFFVTAELGPEAVEDIHQNFSQEGSRLYVVGDIPKSAVALFFQAGADDIFPYPLQTEWLDKIFLQTAKFTAKKAPMPEYKEDSIKEIQRARWLSTSNDPAFKESEGPARTMDRIIVVTSAKGGDGKTTFIGQLGMVLAKKRLNPLAIDGDKDGNLARFIGREAVSGSITDFMNKKILDDPSALDDLLVTHPKTGLKVLPSPLRTVEPIFWETMETCIQAYKPNYPLILIDLSCGYDPVLDGLAKTYATDIFFLTTPDIARLERAEKMINQFHYHHVPFEKIHVVVNKVRNESDFNMMRAAFSQFGLNDIHALPYHEALDSPSQSGVVPVFTDSKSPYAKAFRKILADTLNIKMGSTPSQSPSGAKKKRKKKKEFFSFVGLFQNLFAARGE